MRVFRAVAHRAEVGDGQYVGDVERLADVALALHFAHQQRVAANAIGALGQVDVVSEVGLIFARSVVGRQRRRSGRVRPGGVDTAHCQWISMPPLTSMVAPVM